MTVAYADFLATKQLVVPNAGREVAPDALLPALFPFQRDLVRWALRKGRAALFADTGLGKGVMQLAWAQHAAARVLILAPLAVAQQTVREGARFGVSVTYARQQADAAPAGITITNYEMLHRFDLTQFGAVVLDESSVLKDFEGKYRTRLIDVCRVVPMRLCCTATPAPNDVAELANHAEFLGLLSRPEMLATFFVHDDDGWRLKGHAREPFYRWLASWAMTLHSPTDIGHDGTAYVLPPLTLRLVLVPTDYAPPGQLFATTLQGVTQRAAVRRDTVQTRVEAAAAIIGELDEPWIAWVGRNDEGRELARRFPHAVLVEGSHVPEQKADALLRFASGEVQGLISKARIAGFGLNFQHCARQVFVGLGDSYEQYYQAIRRCWRFGQRRAVTVDIVLTEPEEPIFANVQRKEREARAWMQALVAHVAAFERAELGHATATTPYQPVAPMRLPSWLRSVA